MQIKLSLEPFFSVLSHCFGDIAELFAFFSDAVFYARGIFVECVSFNDILFFKPFELFGKRTRADAIQGGGEVAETLWSSDEVADDKDSPEVA